MYPIGLSSCSKSPDEAFFVSCRDAGITAVEISPTLAECPGLPFEKIKDYAGAAGVQLWSFHLPFMPFDEIDVSSTDETLRLSSVSYDAHLIRKAAAIGIRIFVIHASGEPIADAERPLRMAAAKKSLAALAEEAASCGGVLAVENLPRTCLGKDSAEILELLSADRRLGVCFDTNHLLSESGESFVRAAGSKIVTLHVSDYDKIDEKHWLPGEGVTDWQALYTEIRNAGYGGVWMYELGYGPTASRPRVRPLTPSDFVKNAEEIFNGRPLSVLPTIR
ncbi:MAG: sugar phosphate isomerase/epimerase [Clostridia bacterium]|nr:sugar phosphate isomerase/epimerase [Clostridia bacterium]MBR0536787.1 sugar phosphate isomerase/epimerase [Clostridia bacterium]